MRLFRKQNQDVIRVLVVCMGNICRWLNHAGSSPIASYLPLIFVLLASAPGSGY